VNEEQSVLPSGLQVLLISVSLEETSEATDLFLQLEKISPNDLILALLLILFGYSQEEK
jgi:hypothetical protein